MKHYYKKIMSITSALVLSLSCFNIAFAQDIEEQNIQISAVNIGFETSDAISEIDTTSIKNSITLDKEEFSLYPTFDDSDSAMQRVIEKNQSFLDIIQDEYGLNTMNQENWEDYRSAIYNYGKVLNVDSTYVSNYWSLLSFFDIYENEDQNKEILDLVNDIKYRNTKAKKSLDDLYFLLPYSDQLVEKIESKSEEVMAVSSNYDVDKATKYARDHAEKYNSKYYEYPSDCTNFVSQILTYAGVPETSTWYWESATKNGCSKAWRIANNFCKEFGIDYKNSTDFGTFSKKLSEGDIIVYDLENDSDWDHVAYVTAIGSNKSDFGPFHLNFRDFEIAQHSNDYCKWASKTGWPTLKYDENFKCVYGVIYGRNL